MAKIEAMIEVIIERWTGPDGIAPFSVPPGGATVFCSLSGPKIAPSDREFGALNNARTSVVRNVRFWLQADSGWAENYFCLTPRSRPSVGVSPKVRS